MLLIKITDKVLSVPAHHLSYAYLEALAGLTDYFITPKIFGMESANLPNKLAAVWSIKHVLYFLLSY